MLPTCVRLGRSLLFPPVLGLTFNNNLGSNTFSCPDLQAYCTFFGWGGGDKRSRITRYLNEGGESLDYLIQFSHFTEREIEAQRRRGTSLMPPNS